MGSRARGVWVECLVAILVGLGAALFVGHVTDLHSRRSNVLTLLGLGMWLVGLRHLRRHRSE